MLFYLSLNCATGCYTIDRSPMLGIGCRHVRGRLFTGSSDIWRDGVEKTKTAEHFVYRLGKIGAREQSPAVDENSRHDYGLEQRISSTV